MHHVQFEQTQIGVLEWIISNAEHLEECAMCRRHVAQLLAVAMVGPLLIGREVDAEKVREIAVEVVTSANRIIRSRTNNQEFAVAFERVLKARAAVRASSGGLKGVRGKIRCPVCQAGNLEYSVASNGHTSGHCDTVGCVSWME